MHEFHSQGRGSGTMVNRLGLASSRHEPWLDYRIEEFLVDAIN